jgi:hypothetical protein
MTQDSTPVSGHDDAPVLPPLRRRPLRRKVVYAPSHTRLWVVFVFLVVFAGCGWLVYRHLTLAPYAITLNGTPLCLLDTQENARQVLRAFKSRVAPEAPEAVAFQEGTVAIVRTGHSGSKLYSVEKATEVLANSLTPQIVGAVIVVNGRPLVLLGSKKAAWEAISLMQEAAARGKHGVPTIRETVQIRAYTQVIGAEAPLPVMSPAHAAQELSHPPRPQYHTVKRGESFYVIAMQHNITVAQVKALNPKVNPAALQPGDSIRLPDNPAPVTIVMRMPEE